MSEDPKVQTTIRIPVAVRAKLRVLAKAERREETDYMRKVLWDHVDEAQKDGKLPPDSNTDSTPPIPVDPTATTTTQE